MPLWGNNDDVANSDIAATIQVNKPTDTNNRTRLYGNVTPGAFFGGKAVGQFGVSVGEEQASPQIPHSGWNLRTEGTGLRAGRIHYECLVAMGSMGGDASDDTYIPDYILTITSPSSNTARWGVPVVLTAPAVSRPAGATITYAWQYNSGSGWVTVETGGVYSDATSNTLTISNNALLDGVKYRANARATGANTVFTSNSTITVTPYVLGFARQPSANSMGAANVVVFSVVANSTPAGATIAYVWQKNYGTGWTTVSNGGVFSGATSNTLTISDNSTLTANNFRVQISAPGATVTANSANALLTVL